MDMSGGNSMNMRPIFGGYPFQGNFIDCVLDFQIMPTVEIFFLFHIPFTI